MSTTANTTLIGVGLDTARYGHHASFLRADRQPAAKPLELLESRHGYQQLERRLEQLARQHPDVHFHFRVDAAGQYATNLLEFLHQLPWPKTVSVGQPLQNRRYREVHYPKRKADPVDSLACARFAVVERPAATPRPAPQLLVLEEIAGRLEAQAKQSTREVNRLHNLLGRTFPELATVQNDLTAAWVLRLLDQYPTAQRIAKAQRASLEAIPYLSRPKAQAVHQAAKTSVAAEQGELVEELVRQLVRNLRHSLQAEEHLEELLLQAFDALPDERIKQIATIQGIGQRTAAVLVAKIRDIGRFPTAADLVGYFGIFPEEDMSGFDKYGQPIPPGTMRMSRKGNDLVRKYLWMAAQSAITHNPQVKALYARLLASGRRGDVALGHCMKKLLQQVFGIWTSGRPYDPAYRRPASGTQEPAPPAPHHQPSPAKKVAGRKTGTRPPRKTVTATTSSVSPTPPSVKSPPAEEQRPAAGPVATQLGSLDFAHLRSQLTMERVLRHLGYFDRLRGHGPQRRGACPIHASRRDRGRTFSVHLDKNVFQCFHPPCGAAGNVLDLWCAVHGLTLYEAACHLAETFHLELTPTEKRNP